MWPRGGSLLGTADGAMCLTARSQFEERKSDFVRMSCPSPELRRLSVVMVRKQEYNAVWRIVIVSK